MISDPKLALDRRDGLPDALRVLAEAYPRANWEAHANFGEMIRFWMERHAMFRQLTELLQSDAQALADGRVDFATYAPRLSQYGGMQLITLDGRLERGFELLETDHEAMDGLLHGMADGANAVLQGGEIGPFLERLNGFSTLLNRHLTDEEEIVVPVVLETGFSG